MGAAQEAEAQLLVQIRGYAGGNLPNFFPPNPLYASKKEAKRAAYQAFVREMVRRYKSRVSYWQIENEVIVPTFWSSTLEEYVEVLQIAYRAIKEEDSRARVLIAGYPAGLHIEWVATDPTTALQKQWIKDHIVNLQFLLEKARDAYDILDLHLYESPQYMPARVDYFRAQMVSLGYPTLKPIWVTETGGPDTRLPYGDLTPRSADLGYRALPPEVQASEVVQRFVLALAAGVERVFWHALAGAKAPGDVWAGMNLIWGQERRPALYTYQLMVRKLEGFKGVERLALGQGVSAFRFSKPSGDVFVIWADKDRVVNLPGTWRSITITDIAGNMRQASPFQLAVGANPIFVEASP